MKSRNTMTSKQCQQLTNLVEKYQPFHAPDNQLAFVVLMRICRDYCDPSIYPMMDEEQREQYFLERLKKYKIKFFEKI
ncbi:MAG: hypothetical protein LUG18_01715 [Candidatus Azobacteroides sp.]|nr:hypothetical protein [Candidatus Azobacteroides sp.]